MGIARLVSVNNAIRHAIQHLGIEDSVNESYFIDYIVGALQDIGSYNQLVSKEAIVDIIDYRGEMPCDYYKLHEIRAYNPNQNYRIYNSALPADIHYYNDRILALRNALSIATDPVQIQKIGKELADLELAIIATEPIPANSRDTSISGGVMTNNSTLVGNIEGNRLGGLEFKLEHNTITCSFKTGWVKVIYLAIPTDENGLPLVPENQSFMNAFTWYIAKVLVLRGELKLNISFFDCDRLWQRYCLQARSDANSMNITEMQEVANEHNKLVNNNHLYYQRFRDLGKRQNIVRS